MPLPEILHKQAHQLLEKYCRERVPCQRYHGLRLNFRFDGNHVTLFEEYPQPEDESQQQNTPIARFTYNSELNQWVLFSIDQQERWQIYQSIGPSLNLARLIQALDDDPTGIFWR